MCGCVNGWRTSANRPLGDVFNGGRRACPHLLPPLGDVFDWRNNGLPPSFRRSVMSLNGGRRVCFFCVFVWWKKGLSPLSFRRLLMSLNGGRMACFFSLLGDFFEWRAKGLPPPYPPSLRFSLGDVFEWWKKGLSFSFRCSVMFLNGGRMACSPLLTPLSLSAAR